MVQSPVSFDPVREAVELRDQMASGSRRLAIFLGAGTSMAAGLPGIDQLTAAMEGGLQEPHKSHFAAVKRGAGAKSNVETILTRVRLCRELLAGGDGQVDGLNIEQCTSVDATICEGISRLVGIEAPKGLTAHIILAHWLQSCPVERLTPVEIFTTNYDLLLETAMEQVGHPYFDGFVGSLAPFFVSESVESFGRDVSPPLLWTRLWKIHGSINWCLSESNVPGQSQVIRRLPGQPSPSGKELMVFPSREKYSDSRRLPFVVLQDRLRRFLAEGEALLVVVGYSFSDDHLNEIVFQGLRSNPRLAVVALVYGDHSTADASNRTLPDRFCQYGKAFRNLSVLGPDMACIGGVVGAWSEPSRTPSTGGQWPFWEASGHQFTIGDFLAFAGFLERFVGIGREYPRPDVSEVAQVPPEDRTNEK